MTSMSNPDIKNIREVEPEPIGSGLNRNHGNYTDNEQTEDTGNNNDNEYTEQSGDEHVSEETEMGAQAYDPGDFNDDDFNIDGIDDGGDEIEGFSFQEDRFTASKPVWNDVKFAVFFLVILFILIVTSMALMVKYFGKYIVDNSGNATLPNSVFFQFKTIFLFLFTSLISFGSSMFIFLNAGKSSERFVNFGIKLLIGLFLMAAAASLLVGQILQVILFGVISGVLILIVKKYQPLITLASHILSIVIDVLKKYPSTAIAALIGFFTSLIFTLILTISIGCAYIAYGFHSDGQRIDENSKVTGGLIFTILFLNFAGLYIIDVMKNSMHVTIGGIYGTWYYLNSTFTGMPNNEGLGSFKRAMTYSFGSVCFGSLFVVFFQIWAIFAMIGDKQVGIVGKFFDVVLKIVGLCVGYFNLYAYSYVSLYGVDMVRSASSTLKFFKQRGLQAILNDSIISAALGFYCLIASLLSLLITCVYLAIIRAIFGLDDAVYLPLAGYSFLVTFNITSILIITIVSGSSVFFFALNKDPAVFQESYPFEFQEISRCYPKVLDKLVL